MFVQHIEWNMSFLFNVLHPYGMLILRLLLIVSALKICTKMT